jgi:hypothetical protein
MLWTRNVDIAADAADADVASPETTGIGVVVIAVIGTDSNTTFLTFLAARFAGFSTCNSRQLEWRALSIAAIRSQRLYTVIMCRK